MARGQCVINTSQENSWQECPCDEELLYELGKAENRSADRNLPSLKLPPHSYKAPSAQCPGTGQAFSGRLLFVVLMKGQPSSTEIRIFSPLTGVLYPHLSPGLTITKLCSAMGTPRAMWSSSSLTTWLVGCSTHKSSPGPPNGVAKRHGQRSRERVDVVTKLAMVSEAFLPPCPCSESLEARFLGVQRVPCLLGLEDRQEEDRGSELGNSPLRCELLQLRTEGCGSFSSLEK